MSAWSTPVDMDCACSSIELIRRLKAGAGTESWATPKTGFAGRLDSGSLWLWLAPRGRDSFHAYFSGRVVEQAQPATSRLVGEIRMARGAIALIGFLVIFVASFAVGALQAAMAAENGERPAAVGLATLGFGVLVAVVVLTAHGLRSFRRSRDALMARLERVIS